MTAFVKNKLLAYILKIWLTTFLASPFLMFIFSLLKNGISDINIGYAAFYLGYFDLIAMILSLPIFIIIYFVTAWSKKKKIEERTIKYNLTIVSITLIILTPILIFNAPSGNIFAMAFIYLLPFIITISFGIHFFKLNPTNIKLNQATSP